MCNAIFTPNPKEIEAVTVKCGDGRYQTYSNLISAVTAVYQLSQEEMQQLKAIIQTAQKSEVD